MLRRRRKTRPRGQPIHPRTSLNPLDSAELETIREWTKQLIALSTGAIVLITTVLKEFLPLPSADDVAIAWLGASIVTWAISSLSGVFVYGFIISKIAEYSAVPPRIIFGKDRHIQITGLIQLTAFGIGIIAFAVYAITTIPKVPETKKKQEAEQVVQPLTLSQSANFNFEVDVKNIPYEVTAKQDEKKQCRAEVPEIEFRFNSKETGQYIVEVHASSKVARIISLEISEFENIISTPAPHLVNLDSIDVIYSELDGKLVYQFETPIEDVTLLAEAKEKDKRISLTVMIVDECGNVAILDPEISPPGEK